MTRMTWSATARTGNVARPVTRKTDYNWLAGFDGAWVALVMTAMLFVQILGSISALIMLAAVPVFVVFRYERLPRVALAAGVIGLLPLFALFSATWSSVPQTTLYYATQYLVTVLIGIVIGAALNSQQALLGLFVAFAAHAFASLLIGDYTAVGRAGTTEVGSAFIGIMVSKNLAADASGVGMLIASAVLVSSVRQRQLVLFLLALAVLAIDIWMVIRAESTGALVAAGIAALAMITMQAGRAFTVQARTLLFLAIAAIALGALATQTLWFDAVMESLLKSAGKDSTLTGRTFIWDQAWRMIYARPGLGIGYNAFWNIGNPDAELLWDFAGITEKRGFNFHNTMIEILVHLGYAGLALYITVAGALALVLAIRVTRLPTEFGTFAVAYLCFMGARASVETFGFSPFLYSTALIVAALSYGLRTSGRRRDPIRKA